MVVDRMVVFTYNGGINNKIHDSRSMMQVYPAVRIMYHEINMPERTSAFESYLKDLENKKVVPPKGRIAREGRLTAAVDELSEKSDDEPEIDIAA